MPQMKGAGTTLAYIFPGLPYWAGVVLVGAVITLNVALGGMKGITLVQAVQYWVKMFAISVPIFVLMAVYGHYGEQVKANRMQAPIDSKPFPLASAKEVEADSSETRRRLPVAAPRDEIWLNPFGPLPTKAAKTAAKAIKTNVTLMSEISLPARIATNTGVFKFENTDTELILDVYGGL